MGIWHDESGWWFGTWLLWLSIQLGRTIPTDELICFSWVDDKTWHTSGLLQLDSSLDPRPQLDSLHPLLLTTCPILDDKATEIFPSFSGIIFFIMTPNLVANTISSIFDLLLQTEHVKPQMPSEKCATKTVGRWCVPLSFQLCNLFHTFPIDMSLVGGFKHEFYFPFHMKCHPSRWRTHIFQGG